MDTHRNYFFERVWKWRRAVAPCTLFHVGWQTQVFYMQWIRWTPFSRKLRAEPKPFVHHHRDISAFYIDTNCWPWARRVSQACNTLPSAHKAIHRKLRSRRGCKNHLQAAWVAPIQHAITGRGWCKFRANFYFTSDLLQVLTHHFTAHSLTTLSFEKFNAKAAVLCTWHA